jgi:hypothetical protein
VGSFTLDSVNSYTLSRNISAIQVLLDPVGGMRMGTILQLPEGAQLRLIGDGFNERTVKVSWEGGNYYVFLEDLDEHRLSAHTSVGS